MDMSKLRQLPWEINKGRTPAAIHTGYFKPGGYGYGVKLLVISKMMDIAILSTDIADGTIVFEPWVIAAADRGDRIDFCGVYQRSFEPEEGEPDLCIRRAHWSEDADRDQFRAASDKLAYILSDRQVVVETTFTWLKECPSLTELAEEAEALAVAGCALQRCRRVSEERASLCLQIRSKTLPYSWDLTYSLEVLECQQLENWANRWLTCAQSLHLPSEFIPTHEVSISYRTTLFDRLQMV